MANQQPSDQKKQDKEGPLGDVEPLTDAFLKDLVAELNSDEIVGIILGGSCARNEATRFSDVDIACFIPDFIKPSPKRFMYREGRLLSIGSKTIADVRSELTRPEKAIVIVPGFRHVRILLDKDGSVDSLMQEIKIFEWESLQNAANNYASFSVMNSAEQVHKILNELLKHDELALAYALPELLFSITESVAVQRGVLVKNDSTYYRQVQESVSLESAWTHDHRLALGLDVEPEKSSVRTRGIAVLYLYRETVSILRPALYPEHLRVVEETIGVINETKLLLSISF